ncbi:MAG: ATP-binding protein [Syntrophobacterales bacterium]|jgi:anti-sigma regulatory factor (Ser/Thr protein kinase)|nr:ATP-binding protein [Syntrophobacterales bacterium]
MQKRDGMELLDEITLSANMDSIPALVEFVRTRAWEGGFEDERVTNIELAVAEALENIVRFACPGGSEEITIRCTFYDAPALVIDIIDSGEQFNMLISDAFPETEDFLKPGPKPSLKMLKKGVKNIEYRRDAKNKKNVLALVIPK